MKRIFITAIVLWLLIWENSFAAELPSIRGENAFNKNVEQIVSGEKKLSPGDIILSLKDDITKEIRESAGDIVMLAALAAISGAVTILSEHGLKEGSEAAFFCCFTAMSAYALKCFAASLKYAQTVISALSSFITKLTPVLMVMLTVCAEPASAAAYHPVLMSAIYIVTLLAERVMLPLCVFGAVLSVSGNIGGGSRLSGLCGMINSVNKWIMSAVVTIFTGISAIYGFSAPSIDALSAKAMKFAAGTLVPVVGSFLSDTLETVISGSQLMKNAVGTAGVIAICSICLMPVIKIGVIHLMLRIAAAVSEATADKRISAMLSGCSAAVGSIFGILVMTAVMFILDLCIILAMT